MSRLVEVLLMRYLQSLRYIGQVRSSTSHVVDVWLIFLVGSAGYESGTAHYFNSSSAPSVCSVEPGTATDVAVVVSGVLLYLHIVDIDLEIASNSW